jgi:archaeosine synthase alpha-subunit
MDGLALEGVATVGPLRFPVPAVLGADGAMGPRLRIASAPASAPGHRAISLTDGAGTLTLDFPIPAPEVIGAPGAAARAGEGSWVVHWPLDAAQWEELVRARPELLVLGNARVLLGEGEPFVQAIREIRDRLGARPVLWAPRVALPHRLPMLAYLGIDLLDSTETLWRANGGTYFDLEVGEVEPETSPERRGCECPACRSAGPIDLAAHGLALLERERRSVQSAMRTGQLRERVEARLSSEPLLAELLRYADGHLTTILDERTPVTAAGIRTYVLRESHRRPEIRRFQERFLTRYRSPPSKQVLLVVPCSKTKPYRNSRSHRRFRSAYEEMLGAERVHVASVTSPLGVVPRELEDVPPARHYDIPVTGDWDEGERRTAREALERLFLTGAYERVVVHLDPEEYSFLRTAIPDSLHPTWTLEDGRTTTPHAISALHEALAEALATTRPVPGGPLTVVREELETVAAFQFGPDAAKQLFEPPVRLHGRPWFQRVTDHLGTDLATWREERGLFQLTVAGGKRIFPAHVLEVEVRDEVPLTGDLFVPGVRTADPAIRAGDAVVLVRAGALIAVGEAELPGPLMTQLERGLAVTVRHRLHAPPLEPTPT